MPIPVSTVWSEAIRAQFRRQGYLAVSIEIEPPGLREGTTPSATQTDPLYNINAINDGVSTDVEPQATFEQFRWKGDGSQYLPSKTYSQNLSPNLWADNKVVHSDSSYTTVILQFDQVYEVPGIFGFWDLETYSWPTKLVIRGYGLSGNLLNTYTITNVTSTKQFMSTPFVDAYRVEIDIRGWSQPTWRARITEIVFGLIIDLDETDTRSGRTESTVDPLSAKLPVINASVIFDNYDNEFDPMGQSGWARYFIPKQKVKFQWGFDIAKNAREEMPSLTYFLTKSSVPTETPQFQIDLGTRLDFLTQKYNFGEFDGQSRTLLQVAQTALGNMKLLPSFDGEQPWELDPGLANFTTMAPIPVVNENVALQLIANAAGMALDINQVNGYIRIHPLVTANPESIGMMQTMGDPKIEIQERLYRILIGVNQYSRDVGRSTIYESNLQMTGQQELEVTYNNNKLALEVQATIQGGTIVSSAFYSRRAVLVINPTSSQTTITLTGVVYEENTTYFETYKNPAIDKGVELTMENPFITNTAYLAPLTTALRNVYEKRSLMEAKYLGYPELQGVDPLVLTSRYGVATGMALSNIIDFNGGWNGQISARMVGGEDG